MAAYGLGKRCVWPKCGRALDNDNTSGYCNDHRYAKLRQDRLNQAADLAKNKPTEAVRLQRENVQLRQDLAKAMRTVADYERTAPLEDRLLREVRGFILAHPYAPQLKPREAASKKPGEHEMLVVVSDAHYPEVVDPAACLGLSYGPDACVKRLEYLRDTVLLFADLQRAAYPIRKLTVCVNGDMLSGDIHEELEVTNAFPMSEALVKMAYLLLDMGRGFAASFPAVEFIVMPGNHPRKEKKPRAKGKWNNWEWVMGKFLQALAGEQFAVTVPKDLVYRFDVFRHRIGVSHGDGQKVQSYAGIPFYGLEKRRTKLQSLLKQLGQTQLDLLIYGHFHQLVYEEGQGCSLLINGSIKGGDEYGLSSTYSAQEPVQALLTLHAKHGITNLSRINLGHLS